MLDETDLTPPSADAGAPTAIATPPRRTGALSPLRRRNFSLLFSGQLISVLGDQAYSLALPWTVLAVTGDPRQMAIVLAAQAAARVLLLLIGGALADRISPRLVMLLTDVTRALVVGILGVTLLAGLPPLWIVALLAGLEGAGSGLFLPGAQALLPATVSPEELPAGNGLMQVIQFLSLAIGPLLGGVATAAQASAAFLADAASFAVSALTLVGIRVPRRPAARDGEHDTNPGDMSVKRAGMFGDIGAGMRYAFGVPLLRAAMAVTVFGNFAFSGVMGVALIVLARNLSPSPVTFGVILGATGIGGVIGGLSAGLLGRARRRGLVALLIWIVIAGLIAAIPVLAGPAGRLPVSIALTARGHIVAVSLLMGGLALLLALTDTMFLTIMQQAIVPEYLARVFSLQFLAGGIAQPLSILLAGAITATIGPGVAFLGGAAVLLVAAFIGLASRELRRL